MVVDFLKFWALNHLKPGPSNKSTHFLHNLATLLSPNLLTPFLPRVWMALPHRTMNESNSAGHAAPQPDLFVVLREYYPDTSMPQSSIHQDLTSALLDFDAVNYSASTLAPTSIETFTNLTTPPSYVHPVSKQWCDGQH